MKGGSNATAQAHVGQPNALNGGVSTRAPANSAAMFICCFSAPLNAFPGMLAAQTTYEPLCAGAGSGGTASYVVTATFGTNVPVLDLNTSISANTREGVIPFRTCREVTAEFRTKSSCEKDFPTHGKVELPPTRARHA